jgi:hypothetical protein
MKWSKRLQLANRAPKSHVSSFLPGIPQQHNLEKEWVPLVKSAIPRVQVKIVPNWAFRYVSVTEFMAQCLCICNTVVSLERLTKRGFERWLFLLVQIYMLQPDSFQYRCQLQCTYHALQIESLVKLERNPNIMVNNQCVWPFKSAQRRNETLI